MPDGMDPDRFVSPRHLLLDSAGHQVLHATRGTMVDAWCDTPRSFPVCPGATTPASLTDAGLSCPDGRDGGDGGDGGCDPDVYCVGFCGSDALEAPTCVGGVPQCLAGTIRTDSCPPGTCFWAPPPKCCTREGTMASDGFMPITAPVSVEGKSAGRELAGMSCAYQRLFPNTKLGPSVFMPTLA